MPLEAAAAPAGPPWARRPGALWAAFATALTAASLLAWPAPAALLDWQPALAAAEFWRAWTAAFIHWSPLHLFANAAGAAVVAALGVAARLPPPAALAWFAAWPLTQCGLWLRPELAHFGGLSGVLHAGVAVAALWLVAARQGRERAIGWALAGGLAVKLLAEQPWGEPLRHGGGWDIAVAPLAHATGGVAGGACGALAWVVTKGWQRQSPAP